MDFQATIQEHSWLKIPKRTELVNRFRMSLGHTVLISILIAGEMKKKNCFLFQHVGWTIKQEMIYYNILAFPPVMWLRICHWPEDDLAIFMETEAGIPTSCCALIPAPYGLQGRHSLPLHLSPPLSLSWSIIANSFVYLRASDMSAFLIIFFQMTSSIGFFPHLIQIQIFSWNISIIKKK